MRSGHRSKNSHTAIYKANVGPELSPAQLEWIERQKQAQAQAERGRQARRQGALTIAGVLGN